MKYPKSHDLPTFPTSAPRDAVQFRRMIQRDDVIRADPEAAPRDVHLFSDATGDGCPMTT